MGSTAQEPLPVDAVLDRGDTDQKQHRAISGDAIRAEGSNQGKQDDGQGENAGDDRDLENVFFCHVRYPFSWVACAPEWDTREVYSIIPIVEVDPNYNSDSI